MSIVLAGSRLKLFWLSGCAAFVLPTLADARGAAPTPEEVLAGAARYTVKVNVQTKIGLNADNRGDYSGTGFLIDKKRGWFLSNAHVASRSPGKITLTFKDGKPIPAKRVHVDTFMDMALLSIPVDQIPASAAVAELECSGPPNEGASVFAYGHPWGLDFTASRGIVSGISWFPPQRLVQTDASINHGNSGGPLIRVSDGKVVGVSSHSYKDSEDENATAVGLAQPMPPICHILELLRQGKDASTRMLPIDIATSRNGLEPTVASVSSTAEGFRPGDRIVGINGSGPIRTYSQMVDQLRGTAEPVRVKVSRGGVELEVPSPVRIIPSPLSVRALNISGVILSEPWRVDNAEVDPAGHFVVVDIDTDSDLGASDVRAANRLKYVNGRSFDKIGALYDYLAGIESGADIELIFWQTPEYSEFSGGHIVAKMHKGKLEWVTPGD